MPELPLRQRHVHGLSRGTCPRARVRCTARARTSCVDVITLEPAAGNQARTGLSTSGADDEPGNDMSALNHVIRTRDILVYEFRYRVLHSDAQALRLTITLPAGVDLVAIPPTRCSAARRFPVTASVVQHGVGTVLQCELGNIAAGTTRNATLRTSPRFGVADGTVLVVTANIGATNQQTTGAVIRHGYQDLIAEQNISCSVSRKQHLHRTFAMRRRRIGQGTI